MNKWISNNNIQAKLFWGMFGSQGGNALVNILFGDYSYLVIYLMFMHH